MLNRIIIQGRCGADPELRTTTSGVEVASVNIAVDRDIKDRNGERQTDWFTVVAWRGTAKFLTDYFRKGSMVIVSGRLQARTWEDADGARRKAVEIVADTVYFGDSKPGRSGESGAADHSSGALADGYEPYTEVDEPLPF